MTRAAGAEVLAGSLCILAWVEQNLSVAVWVAVWVSVLTRGRAHVTGRNQTMWMSWQSGGPSLDFDFNFSL